MVRRRGNPFAEKQKRLPFKALLRRDEPFRPSDADEVEAMKLSIANGAEYLSYAGSQATSFTARYSVSIAPRKPGRCRCGLTHPASPSGQRRSQR